MNVTYIIPVRRHLAKVYFPKNSIRGKIIKQMKILNEELSENVLGRTNEFRHFNNIISICQYGFYAYEGYRFAKHEIFELWLANNLYTRAKPIEYPKKLLTKYHLKDYIYLKFNLPVITKEKITTKSKWWSVITNDYWIGILNKHTEILFWSMFSIRVFKNRKTTIDQEIFNIYEEFDLLELDYYHNSFKTMLYRKRDLRYVPLLVKRQTLLDLLTNC